MNERIRELYRQAHGVRHYDGDPALDGNPPTVYWQGEVSAQRFAQLIVEECIVIMNREIDEEESKEKNRTISDMMDLLEQHFGVSE